MTDDRAGRSRRSFLSRGFAAGAGGLVAAALPARAASTPDAPASGVEPFWGEHQGGIVTPQQRNTYFAAFDLHRQAAGDRSCSCCAPGRQRRRV